MELNILNRKGQKLFCIIDVPKVNHHAKVKARPLLGMSHMIRPGLSKVEESAGRKFPTVLVVHGFKGFSTQTHIAAISAGLVSAGFLTIRPDLTKNPGRSYLDFADMTYSQELSDLADLLDFVLKMPQVDHGRIGITGHSLGGMLVAQLAAKRCEIKSLVTLSAVYDFRFVVKRIFKKTFDQVNKDFEQKGASLVWSQSLHRDLLIKKKFYEDVFFRSSVKFAKDITCPTLVISGQKDEAVAQDHADNYLKSVAAKVKRMEIILGSDHNYTTDGALKRITKLVTGWFLTTL